MIIAEAIEEYTEWLKKQTIGIDDKTKEILVARNGRWELAKEIFVEEIKDQKNEMYKL